MTQRRGAPAQRRRPMTREEALARQERQQRRRELEEESRELARGPLDLPFFILVLLLTGIGLVMLLSASFPSAYYESDGTNPMSYFIRQGVFAIMGVAAMLFIGKINYQRFRGLAKPLLYLSVILLLLVLVPGNPLAITRNHATRWLGLPGTSLQFQPSEVAKLAVVIYFADSISKKKDQMRTFRYGIAPYALILIALAAMVGMEPHLSGAILIMGAGAAMMLVGGIQWRWVAGAIGAAAAMLYIVLEVIGYNASRIEMWHNPWLDGLRGAGPHRRHGHHAAVRCADPPGVLDRPPRPGPVRQPPGGGRHDPGGIADLSEHRRGDGPPAHHRHLPALLQLRRNGPLHPAGGDGRRIVGLEADEANEGGIVPSVRS